MVDFATVKSAARGRWQDILPALGVAREALSNKQGPCPGCGGKDRFSFDDRNGNGEWYCHGGGEDRYGDGFDLLGHALGMSRGEALKAVAQHLGLQSTASVTDIEAVREARFRGDVEEALAHELHVLLQVINARVSSRRLAANSRFRALRPEWAPIPAGYWEREKLAVRRIKRGLKLIYGK